ncbi:MAG: hypothetical protein JSV92_01030 [archaeon]|nr:MAG: hypothetical protein JSV92_01030 [archaeon]
MKKSKSLKKVLPVLFVVFLLAPVIFVSGCAEGGDFQSIFSSITGEQQKVVAPKDVLLVEDIQVLPTPPITADSQFTIAFKVTNIGETQEGAKEARNVKVYAYDWGRCDPNPSSDQQILDDNSMTGLKDQESTNIRIYPGGGAELVEWEFTAPSNTELGRMEGKCPIRFKVLYDFDAYTTSDISIISRDRLIDASRAGETIAITPVQTQSRGPIKISVDFETNQPVDENLIVPAIIKVYDKGSGMYEKVPQNKLVVEFPEDFTIISCSPPGWVSYSGSTVTNSVGNVSLIKGESPPIRCDLKLDSGVTITDIKTYNVRAKIEGYQYPLYEERDVAVKPTYGVYEEEEPPTTETTSLCPDDLCASGEQGVCSSSDPSGSISNCFIGGPFDFQTCSFGFTDSGEQGDCSSGETCWCGQTENCVPCYAYACDSDTGCEICPTPCSCGVGVCTGEIVGNCCDPPCADPMVCCCTG